MKERPILFSTEMVKAILDGRKTQTRRVIKPQPRKDYIFAPYCTGNPEFGYSEYTKVSGCWNQYGRWQCPYGQVGDELWVREKWTTGVIRNDGDYECPERDYIDQDGSHEDHVLYYQEMLYLGILDDEDEDCRTKWKPSIHMPRKSSRIQLKIMNIRVERVQDITEDDALAEGVKSTAKECIVDGYKDYTGLYASEHFHELWNSINEKRGYSWESNPWVWVIEFERTNK